jgi:hypothetical protein
MFLSAVLIDHIILDSSIQIPLGAIFFDPENGVSEFPQNAGPFYHAACYHIPEDGHHECNPSLVTFLLQS